MTMKNALSSTIATLPEQSCRSLTWARGKELSAHTQFTVETSVPVYFADPHSPWQRGTSENTNDLLRQYFPKGTGLSRWSAQEIEAVATTLNTRPRKTLGWKTPAEALTDHLEGPRRFRTAAGGLITLRAVGSGTRLRLPVEFGSRALNADACDYRTLRCSAQPDVVL